ncbi:MAG: DUF4214 domain-containing protein [Actinobacteria bacterium]|nr:DUF4214 domain-containing protein [Actinomycetota bacterium]
MQQWRSSSDNVYTVNNPRRDFIVSLYDRALGRAPDPGGYNYWIGGACNQAGLAAAVFGFYASGEFKSRPQFNDVNHASELRARFSALYRGALRRSGSFAERDSWKQWIWDNAPSFPGSTTTQKREAAWNWAVGFFANSPEATGLFTGSGADGEVRLCNPL